METDFINFWWEQGWGLEYYLFVPFTCQRSILGLLSNRKLNRESYGDKGNEDFVKQTK